MPERTIHKCSSDTRKADIFRPILLFIIAIWGFSAESVADDQFLTNGYLTLEFPNEIAEGLGLFTIWTGTEHSVPNREVFWFDYDTSYITFRDANAKKLWVPDTQYLAERAYTSGLEGYSVAGLLESAYNPTLSILGTTGFRVQYEIPNIRLIQDVVIIGDSQNNTYVKHSVTAINTSGTSQGVGMRFMWDIQVGSYDYFRTRDPDSEFTDVFADFPAADFSWYEMIDYLPPDSTLTILGTCTGANMPVRPTPPDYIRHADWDTFWRVAWDFINDNSFSWDGAIFYYWGKDDPIILAPGQSCEFIQYVTTAPELVDVRPLSLSLKMECPASVPAGAEFDYILTVRNEGPGAAYNLILADTLPAGIDLVSISLGGEISEGVLVWRIQELEAGSTFVVSIRVRGPSDFFAHEIANTAQAICWTLSAGGVACCSGPATARVVVQKQELKLRVFPNPFRPAGAVRGTVKFEGIMPGASVRIYTVRGLKVWEGVVETPYVIEWDGSNDSGKPVAPGTYIWVVETAERKEKGFLVVQ